MDVYRFLLEKRGIIKSGYVLVFLLLVLSLACSLPGLFTRTAPPATPTVEPPVTTTLPTSTPEPLPPTVVEVDPPLGAELPLDGKVTLYFNQPMERASVESALQSEPSMEGNLKWADDTTLVINPKSALAPESDLTINLGEGAKSVGGLALVEPVSLKFSTVGYLRLTQSLPEPNAIEVDPTSAIVAAFNRPVVPLGADSAGSPPAFAVSPGNDAEAPGQGEWINTSTYIFYPDPALEGGKTFTVRINPELKGADTSPLEAAAGWSFTTALPALVSISPADGAENVRLDASFYLAFNQPMDQASVEASFRLLDAGSNPVAGKVIWSEGGSQMTFTPNQVLARGQVYSVALDGNAMGRGGTPLGASLLAKVRTVPELVVVSTDPGEGQQKTGYGGVSVVLSGPLAKDDNTQYVTLTPAIPNLNVGLDNENFVLNIYGDFDPDTEYSLSISPDLPDPWGDTLGEPFTLWFRTTSLGPSFIIANGSDVLFLTPEDASLPAQVTNLAQIPLSAGPMPLNDFIAMYAPDGYNFRQVYQPSGAQSWNQSLDLVRNRSQSVHLYVSPDRRSLQPGLYFLRYDLASEGIYAGSVLLVVSDVQLIFKLSPTEALVWAVDLRNNQALANTTVTIYDELGVSLATGQTDAEGVFKSEIPSVENPYGNFFAVIGQPGDDNFALSLSNWSQGFTGWDFGLSVDYSPPRLSAYFYSDRPIYRPGQTVYFRAAVRQAYNGRYSLDALSELQGKLPVTLYGDTSQEISTIDLALSEYGTAHGEYKIPADATPGYYHLGSKAINTPDLYFQVAEYRKPEINLQVDFSAEQALAGRALTANVNARYFFDAPSGNLPVHWALYSRNTYFDLPGYQVGVEDTGWLDTFYFPHFDAGLGEFLEEGDAKTDPDGTLVLEFPTEKGESRRILTVEITATDESGLPVSARAQTYLNPAEYYIGLRPDTWVGRAGEQAGFEVQVVDWQKNPAGVRSLRAEFQKVVWVRQEPQPGREYEGPTFTKEYTPIGSTDFTTSDQGQARIAFTPPDPGVYQLSVSGDGARSELFLWVGGVGQAVWPNLPNQRLRLSADREAYKPGDTAQVFVPNPFSKTALALVTLERSVVLRRQVVSLEPGGGTLSLPLTEEEAPNVYVAVTVLGQDEDGLPDFRHGLLNLKVEPLSQVLNVELTAQPSRAGPGDEVTFNLRVTDAAGKPVTGEFSLAVVDLAVLTLADPNAPDIVPAYYGEQPLGVQTGLTLAVYANRFFYLPGGMGGGGGEAVPSVARERFPDTAYWNAEIVTDADGRAQVSLPLPDTLTTWQVDVRGLTSDTRVGQAQTQVVATKELLVRPVTPRFFVVGDHLQLAAIAQNNSNNDLQAQVSLRASGFTLDDPALETQPVSIPAGGRTRVTWWGTVQDVESLDLVFSVVSGELQDASHPAMGKLPVLHYIAPQTYSTAGVLDESGERLEIVSLPRSFDPAGGGSLRLELAPSLAASMMNALDVLEHYPYECTEQTLSRFLPNLETYRAMQDLNVAAPDLEARLQRTLDEGLQRLMARQNLDGGWGWWQGDESDPYMTAYVVFGLGLAREAGVTVNEDALQRGVEYLRAGLTTPQMVEQTWQLDRLVFAHFALAQVGAGDLPAVNSLVTERARLNPWAQALLAVTLENLSPGSEAARTLFSDLESSAIRSATGAHWEDESPNPQNMTSPVSVSAMVIYALARQDATSPLVADATRYLVSHRQANGAWDSTYSTAWALMALNQVLKGTGEMGGTFSFSATLNGSPLAGGQAGAKDRLAPVAADVPLANLYKEDPNALVISRDGGEGRLYYTAALKVYRPVEDIAPLSRGMTISRAYYPQGEACPAKTCASIAESKTGELVRVRLRLALPNDVYYLLVEDYLPAGAEILDTSLKTSQQGVLEGEEPPPLFDPRDPFVEGWGWWLFSRPRIYDDHITWAADYLPAGTYELTYTLVILQSGEYRVLPARAWQFYFPEVQGTSGGEVFTIKP